jgi:hypothetical protein
MADQLYLSYWLNNYGEQTMLRHYEKLLRLFPFSRLATQPSTFKVLAVDYSEPTVVEIPYPPPVPLDDILAVAKDFQNADACYRLESWWDLWQFEADWQVAPARVAVSCVGPDFRSGNGEHLAIEFGLDANFLPQPELPNSLRMIRSNIKSLLKLVHDLDDALPVETRKLWSESGENFSEKLHQALLAS